MSLPLWDKGRVLYACIIVVHWVVGLKRNRRVFRSMKISTVVVWDIARFNAMLWASHPPLFDGGVFSIPL